MRREQTFLIAQVRGILEHANSLSTKTHPTAYRNNPQVTAEGDKG